MSLIVGTAGWSIPGQNRDRFPDEGSALERYAARFRGVEVNSSFYRPHRIATWARWRDSVPAGFRFAVKMPKVITHERRLVDCAEPLEKFLDEVSALQEKLAVLLLQLPPKFAFDQARAEPFLEMLISRTRAQIACEPRHPSWFQEAPDRMLDNLGVARVAADPSPAPSAELPGGWRGFSYWRLHGSPDMYRSGYDDARLDAYATLLRAEHAAGRGAWCMFDNTAASHATGDALALAGRFEEPLAAGSS